MEKPVQRMLMGNEAIGRGLVENGCSLAASYPGTPASEILGSVVQFARELEMPIHTEWSINEKVAYEVALAHSCTGKRGAVSMKQVGLNVAADPFTRSAYLGVTGGFIVVVADDPGPHSSQTEQDSRFFAHFAKVPVFDPSSPREAKEAVATAYALSERYEIPVMIRPTTRICHARQNVSCVKPIELERKAHFEKNPSRWAATPQFVTGLHRLLNEKIDKIALEKQFYPVLQKGGGKSNSCIVASGVVYTHVYELIEDGGLSDVDLYQVLLPYPLNRRFIEDIRARYQKILVLEESYPVIEMQFVNPLVQGRRSMSVPGEGELTPDVVESVLRTFVGIARKREAEPAAKGRRPSLCAGCSHRAAFYGIKEAFRGGIFPSDIGCYTLGMNLGAVDTCHCMGACISQAAGFYHSYQQDGGEIPPITVTIGDSTFFHAGIPALVNAVVQKARFILVVLDNATTAMTGHQPTPHLGILADGSQGNPVFIPDIVKGAGVRFLREADPCELETFGETLREAEAFCRSPEGGVAVVIARHGCLQDRRAGRDAQHLNMTIEECTGCRWCIDEFECPALLFDEEEGRASISEALCTGCGVCVHVCPSNAIVSKDGGAQ
ncbi:MAG TPA: thiamine pyrophosphate-dependent enzyme [Syntrophorhabdales bacterium]|nr:thiamine pyrophosphate-dependent enzyme [Syntrophorhabdales bacterium]